MRTHSAVVAAVQSLYTCHLPPEVFLIQQYIPSMKTLHCFASRAHLCIYFLLLPATGIPVFFLAGPGLPRKIAISACSRSPLARANTFSLLSLLSVPCITSKCYSDFTLVLSASLALTSIISSTSVVYLPHFSTDTISFWFRPVSFHTLSTTLFYLIPAHPFVNFSRPALSAVAGNLFFGMCFYSILSFQLCRVSICL